MGESLQTSREIHRKLRQSQLDDATVLSGYSVVASPRRGGLDFDVLPEGFTSLRSSAVSIVATSTILTLPIILALGLSRVFGIDEFASMYGPLLTRHGIGLFEHSSVAQIVLALHAMAMVLACSVAQMVLLRRRSAGALAQTAFTVTARSLAAAMVFLLLGTLTKTYEFDLFDLGQKTVTYGGASRVAALRSIDAFATGSLAPVGPLLPFVRGWLALPNPPADDYGTRLAIEYNLEAPGVAAAPIDIEDPDENGAAPKPTWPIVGTVIVVYALFDPLLGLLSASAARSPQGRVPESTLRLYARRFWYVAPRFWGLRVAMLFVTCAFLVWPRVLIENAQLSAYIDVLLPQLGQDYLQPELYLFGWTFWTSVCTLAGFAFDRHLYGNLITLHV